VAFRGAETLESSMMPPTNLLVDTTCCGVSNTADCPCAERPHPWEGCADNQPSPTWQATRPQGMGGAAHVISHRMVINRLTGQFHGAARLYRGIRRREAR